MTVRPRSILIADDEPLALERLRRLIQGEPGFRIVGEATTGPEVEHRIRELRPDIVILDIHLPGIDGLEILRRVSDSTRPAVIFATAVLHRALDAFEVGAVDYLVKPFDAARLHAALRRASQGGNRSVQPPPHEVTGNRIAIRAKGRWILLESGHIDLVEADNQESVVTTSDGKTLRIRELLGDLVRRLPPARFQRVSRFAVVRLEAIAAVAPRSHGDQILELRNGRRVAVSRTRRQELMRRLQASG